MKDKLYRSKSDKKIAGVCGGIGKHFDIDPTIVRIAFIIFTLAGGAGGLLYLILALVIPSEDKRSNEKSSSKPEIEIEADEDV